MLSTERLPYELEFGEDREFFYAKFTDGDRIKVQATAWNLQVYKDLIQTRLDYIEHNERKRNGTSNNSQE